MIKRFFIVIAIVIMGILATGGYALYKYRTNRTAEPKATKAPEQNLTFIEGWDMQDIASYLEKKNLVSASDFLAVEKKFDVSGYSLLKSRPAQADLEGFLFPDTYRIPAAAPTSTQDRTKLANSIIKKMLDNFSIKFTAQMAEQAGKRSMSVYQIVTLASIIEKETGRNAVTQQARQQLSAERKIVAGIFYNRLQTGMPLQSDATINYITNKNDPAPSAQDLEAESAYNTYKYKGLPPGPICNPSLDSLLAALYPTAGDYFYFLHKQPSGEAVYSKTYEEHLKNKAKYLK